MRNHLIFATLLVALTTLNGCGSKGPLILPPKPVATPPAAAPAPADDSTAPGAAR